MDRWVHRCSKRRNKNSESKIIQAPKIDLGVYLFVSKIIPNRTSKQTNMKRAIEYKLIQVAVNARNHQGNEPNVAAAPYMNAPNRAVTTPTKPSRRVRTFIPG